MILAALSGCIRIEQNQPTTTQSYQPSGFRYNTGTTSYTRQTVSETDSTQPEDKPSARSIAAIPPGTGST